MKHVKENEGMIHGEWSKWCGGIGMSRGQATKFITVYDELSTVNGSTWNQIGLQSLYLIATMPEESRTESHKLKSGTTKTVDEMTVKELREVKAELKKTQEERAQAVAREQSAIRDAEMTP
ncbi:hypothetical protein MPH47_13975 [Psychrobacillus psychrodurans]|nr:hypothetical protein [Psychrobacillus psychrodurans]